MKVAEARRSALASLRRRDQVRGRGRSRAAIERAVALKHGLTWPQLHAMYARFQRNGGKSHGRQLLSDEDEGAVLDFITGAAWARDAVVPADVIHAVREAFKLGASWDGWKWWTSFQRRHRKVLKRRKVKPIHSRRVRPVVLDDMKAFLSDYKKVLAETAVPLHMVLSMDESLITDQPGRVAGLRLVPPGAPTDLRLKRENPKGCIVPVLNAAGGTPAVFIVLAAGGKLSKKDESRPRLYKGAVVSRDRMLRGEPTIYYLFTPTGWVTGPAWLAIVDAVVELHELLYPGLNLLVLADQNGPHQYGPAVLKLLRAGHRCLLLPPGCTAFAQPADRAAFAVYKNNLNHVYRQAGQTPRSYQELIPILVKAVQQSFSVACVRNSWADSALFPLDEPRLIYNCRLAIAADKSTPVLTAAQLAAAHVIQQARDVVPRGVVRTGAAPVQHNRTYMDWQLVDLFDKAAKEKEAKEARKQERARAKAARAAKGKVKKAPKRGESRAAKRQRVAAAAARIFH